MIKLTFLILLAASISLNQERGKIKTYENERLKVEYSVKKEGAIYTVNGKVVVKENAQALPGMNIIQEKSQYGTVTNQDGIFQLEVSKSRGNLILAFNGFDTIKLDIF